MLCLCLKYFYFCCVAFVVNVSGQVAIDWVAMPSHHKLRKSFTFIYSTRHEICEIFRSYALRCYDAYSLQYEQYG